VGTKIGAKLNKLGAETVLDLLYLFPRRYDDYSLMKPINKIKYGEQVTIIGTIWETRARRTRTNQVMVQSLVNDGTATIQATWYNQPWLAEQLPAGMQIVLSGKVDQYLGHLVFQGPEWEPLELEPLRTRRLVPVYPLTEGLNGNRLREIVRQAVQEWAGRVPDPVPADIRHRQKFYGLADALRQMHFPVVSAPAVVLSLVLDWNLTATALAITMPAVVLPLTSYFYYNSAARNNATSGRANPPSPSRRRTAI